MEKVRRFNSIFALSFFCCCCFYTKMMFEMSLRDSRLRCMRDWETFSWVGQTDPLEEG